MRSDLVPGVMASGVLLVLPFVLLGMPRSDDVAVIGPPADGLAGAARAVAQAGGQIVNAVAGGPILLARSERPGFAARLYAAGAWLVLPAFGGGCAGRGPSARASAEIRIAPGKASP
ncbi:hypothetical protein MMB17_22940 [Methylobacterium organophilum]|uniref:hypothetical protein n=1 Tax=Methylobacterium organophilum TaxID=410 RepID=UPI001F1391D6|nr:hypothetical protein [Methylobacterium organophilum]UMY17440.1 hypothetical protein MMB17_22940 [Methylobacterium organophilum]